MTSNLSNKLIEVPISHIVDVSKKDEITVYTNNCVGNYRIRQAFLDFTHVRV